MELSSCPAATRWTCTCQSALWACTSSSPCTTQVAAKQRLVALVGLLRQQAAAAKGAMKLLVFLSSCDSVDFHQHLLAHGFKAQTGQALLPCPVWKLHGSMLQASLATVLCLCLGCTLHTG